MRHWLVVAFALVGCGGTQKSQPPHIRLTAKDVVERATPAIVRIEAGGDKVGTGFILDGRGLVATNLHVVAGTSAIKVKLKDGSEYDVQQIAGVDLDRDLALLRIAPRTELPALSLGDSDAMSAGDQIIAIGNPLGVFDYSVSNGLVSQVRVLCTKADVAKEAPRRKELLAKSQRSAEEAQEFLTMRCPAELTLLQISAPISQGSSGGPLFNQFGEVIGVTTAIITAGQNINIAVPTNYLKSMLAAPEQIALEHFKEATRPIDEANHREGEDDGPRIVRMVPDHPVAVFDGCNEADVTDIVRSIASAIESGAPLYNAGNREACFRIYEGTATKWEHDSPCKGVSRAFGDGLLRANAMKSWKEKAWAMRDTFDGLTIVAEKWARSGAIKPKKK